jgi:hypothetical protein
MYSIKLGVGMWFVRFFIALIGLGIIYMVFTQETIPLSSRGRMSFSYNLWDDPVRFAVYFAVFCFFEWFLIKVHAGMMEEERNPKMKKKKKKAEKSD